MSLTARLALVAISAAQLVAGAAGHVIALRDHRAFDIAVLGWRGQPDRVVRDSWWVGTALSAPVFMLATQAVATARLAAGPSGAATRVLGALGVAMVCGSLLEKDIRAALSPRHRDSTTTPVAVVGVALAIAMAVAGLRGTTYPALP